MKYIIAILFACIAASALAQKEFEGEIRYTITSPEKGEKETVEIFEIKAFFAPNRLLLRILKEDEEEDILLFIDSAKVYTFDKSNKTFRVKKLRSYYPLKTSAIKEVIAGYSTTPLETRNSNWANSMGRNASLWFADSLYFPVPNKLEGNEELLLINNNRILLKAKINLVERMEELGEEEIENMATDDTYSIKMVAVQVIPGPQPASLFTIPGDYKKWDIHLYPFPFNDSVSAMVDTAIAIPDTAFVETPKIEPPPARKTPAKAPVKKSTSNKAPIKKED